MHQLKLALRQLIKQKTYSLIAIIGLTIAFSVSVVIFSFVHYHLSFDKNIENAECSYRITTSLGDGATWAATFAAFDGIIKENPVIEKSVVFYKQDESFEVSCNESSFQINDPVYAAPDYITFFNINLKSGDKNDLDKPNSVIISETCAKALFDDDNPIGKSIEIKYNGTATGNDRNATIVGIFSKKQQRSHLKYDIIHSKKGFYEGTITNIEKRKVYGAYVYLTLLPNVSPGEFEKQTYEMLYPKIGVGDGPQLEDFKIKLQPISEIHFNPDLIIDLSAGIKKSILHILIIIGILLFSTSLFNFLLMNMAKSEEQITRIKVQKALGGSLPNIIKVDAFKIFIVVLTSMILAGSFILAVLPVYVNRFFNNWQFNSHDMSFWLILALLGMVTSAITLLATSSITSRSVRLFKTGKQTSASRNILPLIIFQFTIVIGLISYSMVISKQLQYINTKSLGYNAENIMIYRIPGRASNKINILKEQARKISGVTATATARHYPGFRLQDVGLETDVQNYPMKFAMVDEDAIDLLGVQTLETFSESETSTSFFINESLYKAFSKNFTKEQISTGDFNSKQQTGDEKLIFTVNGVVKDFHYSSFYNHIGYFVFFVQNSQEIFQRFLLVRFNQNSLTHVKNEINTLAQELYGIGNIEPSFLDKELEEKYSSEQLLLSVSKLLTILTIIIACLGLIAFTLNTIQSKSKEFGIRKVNGAKSREILAMINKTYIVWIVISFVIALPLSYYGINYWLNSFAYKIKLSWWIFVLAGIITLGIALLTVSWQSLKAATKNPVESLKYE